LVFNVTAVDQIDENGYGPAYLLNGLSNMGYWYQVGLSYNWPYVGGGYAQGFAFNFEVFAPNQSSVYPSNGGGGLKAFTGEVHSGDSVVLILDFFQGNVVMYAEDLNTGAYAIEFFAAEGADHFVGTPYAPANSNGYFTGLMTEWYHATPFFEGGSKVVYSQDSFPFASAWMWMDEFDPYNPNWEGVWFSTTTGPVDYLENPFEFHSLSFRGLTVSSNAFEFHSGLIVPLKTAISLIPSEQSSPVTTSNTFEVKYTYNGQKLTAYAKNGTLNLSADNGTEVMVAGVSSDSSATEAWVLNSKSSAESLKAGSNATFYYYNILSQTTSFSAPGGTNQQTATLTYLTAPEVGSSKSFPTRIDLLVLSGNYQKIWVLRGSTTSISNPIGSSSTERWITNEATTWIINAPNQMPSHIAYTRQFLLEFEGVNLEWQWVNSGTTVNVAVPGVFDREEDVGQRVKSYSIDAAVPTGVKPTKGTLSIPVLMNSPHKMAFGIVKQLRLAMDEPVEKVLSFVTPPTIANDNYWYDEETPLTLVLKSILERGSDTGTRLSSYTVNGEIVSVSSSNPVVAMNQCPILLPQKVSGTIIKQYRLTLTSGTLVSITAPSLKNDDGWYDAGREATANYAYSWNETLGTSRTNALAYSIGKDDPIGLVRSGNGTFTVDFEMNEPQNITVTSTMQYAIEAKGSDRILMSPASPTADTFFDSGTSLTISTSKVTLSDGNTRQRLAAYTLDGIRTEIESTELGNFTTIVTSERPHKLEFDTVIQYLVSFDFTDNAGVYQITPKSFGLRVNNSSVTSTLNSIWIDSGANCQIAGVDWQGTDVKPRASAFYTISAPSVQAVPTNVYSAKIIAMDLLGIPVGGALLSVKLANGTTIETNTNADGVAEINEVPLGILDVRVTSFSLTTQKVGDASAQPEITLTTVVSNTTLLLAVIVALVATALLFLLRRRQHGQKQPR
jgi:hypothetical protein